MSDASPLAQPGHDSPVLASFLQCFQIDRSTDPRTMVSLVSRAFSRLPYENLTKILAHADEGRSAFRSPERVVEEHLRFGAGGTCFSLTATLLHLLRSLGFPAEPILADRPYGPDTHSALLVWIDGQPHLVDPGYLLTDPVPIATGKHQTIQTSFNEVTLQPGQGEQCKLFTTAQGKTVERLTFKTAPVDTAEFMRAWDASFDWDMMHYPLLTRVVEGRQIYLQRRMLQSRSRDEVSRTNLHDDDLVDRIERDFGLDRSIVARALAMLGRRGDH